MNQKWHPWHLWEDHQHGFYDNTSGKKKKELSTQVTALFCDIDRLKQAMLDVVLNWPYSMEHNLTNSNLNHVAYVGQCAACLSVGAPATVTMETWSTLKKPSQEAADAAAVAALSEWQKSQKNQLCLNFI